MKSKWTLYLFALLAAAVMMAGCGSDSGSSVNTKPEPGSPGQNVEDADRVSDSSCTTCHTNPTSHHNNFYFFSAFAGELTGGDTLLMAKHSCQDCHGGGQYHHGVGPMPYPNPDLSRCISCHEDEVGKYLTAAHNYKGPEDLTMKTTGRTSASCRACHTSEGFAEESLGLVVSSLPGDVHSVGCATCHNPIKSEVREFTDADGLAYWNNTMQPASACVYCHTDLSVRERHMQNNPISNEIAERFYSSRHANQGARAGDCSACHSHQGGVALLAMDRFTSDADLKAAYNEDTFPEIF